jgi:hypothetical protein
MNKTSSTQAYPQKKADCTVCRHLFITYEARFPYACRKLGFKSQRLPHLEVLAASAEPCASFTSKIVQKI